MAAIVSQKNQVDAFNFFDLIRAPLGQVSESIFGWNPFKLKNPLGSSYMKTSLDDFDLLKTANNLTNDTITKSHYKYGCNCIEFSCRCCSHIEINRFKLNDTGLIRKRISLFQICFNFPNLYKGCLSLFYTNKNYTVETKYHLNDLIQYDEPIASNLFMFNHYFVKHPLKSRNFIKSQTRQICALMLRGHLSQIQNCA